ncbi:hydroxyacid dehydrogenase [Paenibacillus herberti]|uniref:Hydroxyacid dehydrogenase n=1 Tax=Paenibacillus herberti TaxID=1619309 RepID=A0A229P324_9BACL|nr:hydroxyacid dehydrogenase [Paenibacillus herberti]OXM16295.1 hydroxyacid dehydrogenase [Paenibacillus herberti]
MKAIITELNWPIGIELLQEQGWEVLYDPELWKDRERLQMELQNAEVIIVRNQTKVDAELLGWGNQLRVIGRLGVGLDNIDLQTAADRNIPIIFGKNANATSVAEYVISGLFASARFLHGADRDVKSGGWNRKKYTGVEVAGKTLGLIGVGEIGHRVAVRARALGLKVIGYDPFVAPYDFPAAESGIELVEMDRVLAESDYISLHVPLTAHTRHLFNREIFHKMKRTAIIINSARGGIIHEVELNEALENGVISGAILDVLEQEPPPPDHPLLKRPNCLITPHIAGLTEESQIRTAELVSNEIISEMEGKPSLCRVNGRR